MPIVDSSSRDPNEPIIMQKMVYARATKNSFVFQASDFGMPIPSQYINKLAFPFGAPRFIWVGIYEVIE